MAIDSKNLLVAVKAFSRANPLPLDASEVYESMSEALAYASQGNAYGGQTIKVKNASGKYESYVLNGDAGRYTLDKVGVDTSLVKNYVQIVDSLPLVGQEQGVIYLNISDNKGYIYDGSDYKVIFEQVEGGLNEKIVQIESEISNLATIDSPTFTGSVTLPADPEQDMEAATKQYVDRMVSTINSFTAGIVDQGENPLPDKDYTVGQTFRVAEAGRYAGVDCEVGDLIIVVNDYQAGAASPADFLIVQANIDGAVSGPDSATDANIAIFDGVTGKKIADSTVTIASVKDAIAKAHEHSNFEVLETYDKTQQQLLSAAAAETTSQLQTFVTETLEPNYYNKTQIDEKIKQTVSSTQVASLIDEAIGEIPEGETVKNYIDRIVGSGGVDVAEQIEKAKNEAIQYSTTYVETALTITEF